MNLKNKFVRAINLYFMLVTLITILMMALGMTFDGERTFSYSAYASPLIYAAIGVIPVFIQGNEKELSVKRLVLRRITGLAIIEIIILFIAFSSENVPTEKRTVVAGIAIGIIVIYVLANVLEYLFEKREARELNDILDGIRNRQ